MKTEEKNRVKVCTIIVAVAFTLLFVAIGLKALYLQVFRGAWLSRLAAGQYEKSFSSLGQRGTIFDTRHREMALSVEVTSVGAFPAQINHKDRAVRALAEALNLNRRKLGRDFESSKPFIWVKRHVTPKEEAAVRKLNLEGVDFIPERSRFYPNKTLAAQVLGFAGIDGHGLEGLEFYYNRDLEGPPGNVKVLCDALGRDFDGQQPTLPTTRGNNLVLTIDRNVQYIAEHALAKAAKEFQAQSGMALVMQPQTGAILALAHYPFFNPNAFRDYKREDWRNRAITDPFEPGSTMKIFLAAAALESGRTSARTIFFCENGAYRIGRNVFHDTHPHGWLSLQQIVKYSSNIGAVKVTETIGRKKLYQTLRNFGFGERSGIDCPGETSGSLAPYKRWTKIDAGAISFGQGVAVSALQLASAASAIANDGILMKPHIVQAVTDPHGRVVRSFGPQKIRKVISADTAATVRRIMRTVITEGGTGENAALDGFSVCGKTGTAQKLDDSGTYSHSRYVASFVGFVPAERPALTILVIVDEPEKAHYGGVVAAPVFRKIAQETLTYLKIGPQDKTSSHKRKLIARTNDEARS